MLATLCQCWYCEMLRLLLVDCCYFYNLLLSLSPLATLCRRWYRNMMLLVASWFLLSYYFFAVTLTACYALPMLILWDVCHCRRLIVVILLFIHCRYHRSLRFAKANTARCCCWWPVDCCIAKFLLSLSLLATLCQCWYCGRLLLPLPPVDCCYFINTFLLSLSPFAALRRCWYRKMMLLAAASLLLYKIVFADAVTARRHVLPILTPQDNDAAFTASWLLLS